MVPLRKHIHSGALRYYPMNKVRTSYEVVHIATSASAKHHGPFKILEKISSEAYKLHFPSGSQIHPVFHVSQLKLCKGVVDKPGTLPMCDNEGLLLVFPIKIINRRLGKLKNKVVAYVLVQWPNGRRAPEIPFVANGVTYPWGYNLVDWIYPKLATLVKTIPELADDDHKRILYKLKQESTRKDVERAFGVLKKIWAILANPTQTLKKERIINMMYTCIILLNMIQKFKGVVISPGWFPKEAHHSDDFVLTDEQVRQVMRWITSAQAHQNLQHDLIEFLSRNKGCKYVRRDHGPNLFILLEAVASLDLWIWHAFFGRAPEIPFVANGVTYPWGIHSLDLTGYKQKLATLVKTIPEPADDDHKCILYKLKQESARKDVERAFGVLKKIWAILANPTQTLKKERIINKMYTCIILLNMIQKLKGVAISPGWFPEEAHHSDDFVRTDEQVRQVMRWIRSAQAHQNLRADLIEQLSHNV
ncbi:ALP1-like protein [Tanacetum coccineum]